MADQLARSGAELQRACAEFLDRVEEIISQPWQASTGSPGPNHGDHDRDRE
jgi:hypothetical protein